MSELQDLYESINPIPENLSRCGEGYCQHVYVLIDPYASGYKARFEGFKQGLQHQQSKVDELQKQLVDQGQRFNEQSQRIKDLEYKNGELQKQVDAVRGLAQTLWEKSYEKHTQGKVWESKALGECADEILDVLEQALKGGSDE